MTERIDRYGIDHSTYHDALAPFATTSPQENAAFLAAMDAGLARRARDRRKAGGTQAGAERAGDRDTDHEQQG